MKTLNIKLGSTENGSSLSMAAVKDTPSEHFPTLHISSKEELDLPDKGVMLVKYRKVRSSSDKPANGEPLYSCTFDIKEIVAVTGKDSDEDEVESPAKNRSKETEDALDAILREKMGKRSKEKEDY
jgi:hypothetical protein